MSEFKTAYNLGTYYRTDGKTYQKKLDYRFYDAVSVEKLQEVLAEKAKTAVELSVEPDRLYEEWTNQEPFIRITGWETELDEYHLKAAQSLKYK